MTNSVALKINLDNYEYELNVVNKRKVCDMKYPKLIMDDSVVGISGDISCDYTHPVFEILNVHVLGLNVSIVLGSTHPIEIINTLKLIDVCLGLSLISLVDYQYLISTLVDSIETDPDNMYILDVYKVNSLGDYSQCKCAPTNDHLPIMINDSLIGYFESGDRLYLLPQYATIDNGTLANQIVMCSCDKIDRIIDQESSPSYIEYLTLLKDKFKQFK